MDISQYITQTRQMGLSDDKIKELLLSQGWTNDQINSSLNPSFLSSPQQISNAPNVTSPKRAGFKLIYVFGPILICTLAWTIITLIEYFLKIDPTHPPSYANRKRNRYFCQRASILLDSNQFCDLHNSEVQEIIFSKSICGDCGTMSELFCHKKCTH